MLDIAGIIASSFLPFVPKLKYATLAVELSKNVAEAVTKDGTVVVDENGNPLTNEQIATAVQAKWDEALEGLGRIGDRARTEIDRTE